MTITTPEQSQTKTQGIRTKMTQLYHESTVQAARALESSRGASRQTAHASWVWCAVS